MTADDELEQRIAAVPWRRSPGYVAPDCQQVGPHEYILVHEQPDLFNALYQRLRQPDAYRESYNGKRIRYVRVGMHKYWAYRFVLNREAISFEDIPASCLRRVSFLQAPSSEQVRRVTTRTHRAWRSFRCRACGRWHVTPNTRSGRARIPRARQLELVE